MVAVTTSQIYAYNGSLLDLLGLSVAPSFTNLSAVITDPDGVLGQGDTATISIGGAPSEDLQFDSAGTVSAVLGLLGSRDIAVFTVASNPGVTYLYAPDGLPTLLGATVLYSYDLSDTTFALPTTTPGIVDGTDDNDLMPVGYTDTDGDQITNSGLLITGNDTIDGKGGNDTIFSGSGNDSVLGGSGNDVIDGGAGNDTLDGGIGNDSIIGGNGADSILGGSGDDTINGGAGNDTIYGNDGNDSITGGSGNDVINGGAGNDTLDGGTGADTVYGGDGDDVWLNSEVSGSASSDNVYLGSGDDYAQLGWLQNGTQEIIDGGDGTDTFALDHASINNFDIDLTLNDSGTATSALLSDDNVILNFENVRGNAGVNELTGNSSANQLLGLAGNDILDGGDGSDTLDGGDDNDIIFGGDGDDYIIGGAGNDTLTGGNGNDVFTWDQASYDVISDFGVDDGGAGDGLTTNNDFVDLSDIFKPTTVEAYNAANGTSFTRAIDAMNHDLADGVVNFNGIDMSGPTLTLTGVTGGLTTDQTNVTCFTSGTKIKTLKGESKIDDLKIGDKILTLDSGYQPIRWIGSSPLSSNDLVLNPKLRPIRIRAGSLGVALPEEDLLVSPQHRVLIRSNIAKRMFGQREVLIAAKHLTEIDGIDIAEDEDEVIYWHFLFEQHQIVFSNGAPTESLFTGPEALKSVSSEAREEIFEIFPELMVKDREDTKPARTFVPGRRARKLAERSAENKKLLVT